MQSNLVSRPDESAGFGTFCGLLSVDWGIFSTCLKWPTAGASSTDANEETLRFVLGHAHFYPSGTGWIKGFGDICIFKVIPLVCN
jgi:hypothetical protein